MMGIVSQLLLSTNCYKTQPNIYSCLAYDVVCLMLSIVSPLQLVAMILLGVQESLRLELGTQFSGNGLSTSKE